MPPAMKRLLADLQLPANRFDRRALVEVHLRLAQLRNDLLRRVSLPFHRVLPPSRAVRLSYQLVHLEGVRSSLLLTLIFRKNGFSAEVADQVKACSERYDILEKEQAQIAHEPHMVNSRNGNNRAGGSYDHSAGYKEHECSDESADDTGFRLHIACDKQYRCSNLGKADDIGADIRAE